MQRMIQCNDNKRGSLPHPMAMVEGILEVVGRMQHRQNAWNEEMHRLFLVEERQKQESDRLTERVHAEEALLHTNDTFNKWVSLRADFGVQEDLIKEWYHIDAIVAKTPFVAVAPWPRGLSGKGQMEGVNVVDAFRLSHFFVQTVPLHLPLSKLSPTFVSLPFHVDKGKRASKSSLSVLPYTRVSCACGDDLLRLIAEQPLLIEALDRTPCLFLNDYVPCTALCLHCVIVGGLCVAAEVACDVRLAAHVGLEEPEVACGELGGGLDVLSFALKEFVEENLVRALGNRSFRALLLGEVAVENESCKRPITSLLLPTDIRFLVLNIDNIDGCEFECFTQEEILGLSKKLVHHQRENRPIPPMLRFLYPPGMHETRNAGGQASGNI